MTSQRVLGECTRLLETIALEGFYGLSFSRRSRGEICQQCVRSAQEKKFLAVIRPTSLFKQLSLISLLPHTSFAITFTPVRSLRFDEVSPRDIENLCFVLIKQSDEDYGESSSIPEKSRGDHLVQIASMPNDPASVGIEAVIHSRDISIYLPQEADIFQGLVSGDQPGLDKVGDEWAPIRRWFVDPSKWEAWKDHDGPDYHTRWLNQTISWIITTINEVETAVISRVVAFERLPG